MRGAPPLSVARSRGGTRDRAKAGAAAARKRSVTWRSALRPATGSTASAQMPPATRRRIRKRMAVYSVITGPGSARSRADCASARAASPRRAAQTLGGGLRAPRWPAPHIATGGFCVGSRLKRFLQVMRSCGARDASAGALGAAHAWAAACAAAHPRELVVRREACRVRRLRGLAVRRGFLRAKACASATLRESKCCGCGKRRSVAAPAACTPSCRSRRCTS